MRRGCEDDPPAIHIDRDDVNAVDDRLQRRDLYRPVQPFLESRAQTVYELFHLLPQLPDRVLAGVRRSSPLRRRAHFARCGASNAMLFAASS